MNCHLLRALLGYGEKADIQAGCGGKTDGVSKVDRKYSSGQGREGREGRGGRAIKQRDKNELERKRGERVE